MGTIMIQRLSDRLSPRGSRTTATSDPWSRQKAFSPVGLWRHLGPLTKGLTKTFPDEANRKARLEAVLLLAREPLTTRKLAKLANLTEALLRRGYSDEDILKIWGDNFRRVYRGAIGG